MGISIGRFKTRNNIDPRVQETRLDQSGVGAVGKVVGEVARSVGVGFGVEILQRREIAQANQYMDDGFRDKRIRSAAILKKLRDDMDMGTGLLKTGAHKGKDLMEIYIKWEDDATEEYANNSPSDLAKESYLKIERGETTERILKADVAKNGIMIRHADRKEMDIINMEEKAIDGDRDFNTQKGLDAIRQIHMTINRGIGNHHSPESASIRIRESGERLSVAGVFSLMLGEKYIEAARSIGMARLIRTDPAMAKSIKDALVANGLLTEKDRIVTARVGENAVEDIYFKHEDGIIRTSEGIAVHLLPHEITFMEGVTQTIKDPRFINVKAKKKKDVLGAFERWITPEYQRSMALRIASAMRKKNKVDTSKLMNDANNMITLHSNDQVNNQMRSRTGTTEYRAYTKMLVNLIDAEIPTGVKDRTIGKLIASRQVGQMKDANDLQHREVALRNIRNLPDLIKQEYKNLGFPVDETSLANAIKWGVDKITVDLSEETSMALNQSGQFLIDHSPNIKRKFEDMDSSFDGPDSREIALQDSEKRENYASSAKNALQQMGLPAHTTDRSIYPDNYIETKAVAFKNALAKGQTDNFKSAVEWLRNNEIRFGDDWDHIVGRLENHGIDPMNIYAISMPDTEQGNNTAKRIMENVQLAPEINKRFGDNSLEEKEIEKAIQSKTRTVVASIMRNFPDPKQREKIKNTFQKVIKLEAMRDFNEINEGTPTAIESVDRAIRRMYSPHVTTLNFDDTLVTISNTKFRKYNIDPKGPIPKLGIKTFKNTDNWKGHIDVELSLPNVIGGTLNVIRDPKTKQPYKGDERKQKAIDFFTEDSSWELNPTYEGNFLTAYFKNIHTGQMIKALSGPQEEFKIHIKDLKTLPELVNMGFFDRHIFGDGDKVEIPLPVRRTDDPSTGFLGRLFSIDKSIFKDDKPSAESEPLEE